MSVSALGRYMHVIPRFVAIPLMSIEFWLGEVDTRLL